jgi:hypothetical protein
MNNKKLLLTSFFSGLFLLLITEPSFNFLHGGYFNDFEVFLLEPLFFTLISYFVSSLLMLFFSNQIFKLWLRKIVSWFLPLSIFIISISGGGSGIADPGRTGFAIFFGFVLVAVTLVFSLVHKFKYKR